MKNETEELNGHNALPKTFNSAPSTTSHPPFPFKLNSVRSGTCWKRRAAEKHEKGDEAKARYVAYMTKVRRWSGGIGSEFVLAKGRGRCTAGGKKERKKKERRKKRETIRGCDADGVWRELGELAGGQILIHSEVPQHQGKQKSMNCLLQGQKSKKAQDRHREQEESRRIIWITGACEQPVAP